MTNFKRFALGFRFDCSDAPKGAENEFWNICFNAFSVRLMEGLEMHLYRQEHSSIDPTDTCICVISNMSLARSKKVYDAAKRCAALTGALTLYRPYVQLNCLELLGDFEFLGTVAEGGSVRGGDVSYGAMRFTGPEYEKLPNRKKNPFVLIVPDAPDAEITSAQSIRHIRKACREVFSSADIRCIPISGGGKGTMDAITTVKSGRYVRCEVHGSHLELCDVYYAVEPDETAVIEAAQICDNDGLQASSYGIGEMVKKAVTAGYGNIWLALGENERFEDQGFGCLEALGMAFYDENGELISALSHDDPEKIVRVDVAAFEQNTSNVLLRILAGVKNESKAQAAAGAVNRVLCAHYNKNIACDVTAALAATVKTEILPGAATVAAIVGVPHAIAKADVVITACADTVEIANPATAAGVVAQLTEKHGRSLAALTLEGKGDEALPGKSVILRIDKTAANRRQALEQSARAVFSAIKIGQLIPR